MAKFTKKETRALIKETKHVKTIGKVIHMLMWFAYVYDLRFGEMINLKIKDVFDKSGINVRNLNIERKTKDKTITISVIFNDPAKNKLLRYYKYLDEKLGYKTTKAASLFPGKNGKRFVYKTLYRNVKDIGNDKGLCVVTLEKIRKSKF
jgi:site-specific recombinase XerD